MGETTYELLSLGLRYWFILLIFLTCCAPTFDARRQTGISPNTAAAGRRPYWRGGQPGNRRRTALAQRGHDWREPQL